MILENTFTSIPAMAELLFPLTKYLPLVCYRNKVSGTWQGGHSGNKGALSGN